MTIDSCLFFAFMLAMMVLALGGAVELFKVARRERSICAAGFGMATVVVGLVVLRVACWGLFHGNAPTP